MRKKYIFLISLFALLVIFNVSVVNAQYDDYTCSSGSGVKTCLSPSKGSNNCSISNPYTIDINYEGTQSGEYDPGFAICDNGSVGPAFCVEVGTENEQKFHNNVELNNVTLLTNNDGVSSGVACTIKNYISSEYSQSEARGEAAYKLFEDAIKSAFDNSFSSTTYANPGYGEGNYTAKMKVQKLFWNNMSYTGTCSKALYKKTKDDPSTSSAITKNAKITLSDDNLSISDDGSYYISKEISINTDGSQYTASFEPSSIGAVLCENSECANEIDISNKINKTKVYIKIPSNKVSPTAKSVKLTISFDYTKNKTTTTTTSYYANPVVKKYSTSQAQDLITYSLTTTTSVSTSDTPNKATAKDDSTVNIGIASISIKKVDSENKRKAVEGAVYKLYRKNSKGSYVDAVHIDGSAIDSESLITDEKGEISISNLPYGDYKIEEISAPKGYTISSKPLEFKLDGNKTLDFTNTPRKIIFSKQDIAKEGELKGAKICIYNYDDVNNKRGSEIKCYISGQEKGYENKPYEYYLAPGVYSLIEDGAPAGYDKLETEFVFKVNDKYEIELESAKSKNNIQINDNKITIYNQVLEVPEVPDTGKVAKIAYSIIGSVLVLSGGTLIYLVNKKKKVIGQI